MMKISMVVLIAGLLLVGVSSAYYCIDACLNESEESYKLPEELSEEFKESLMVGEAKYHKGDNMYYTKTTEGHILGTGGTDAKKNIQIEMEQRGYLNNGN